MPVRPLSSTFSYQNRLFFFLFLIFQSCIWQVGEEEKERNNHYTTITYTSNNTRTEEIYGLPADRLFVLCELRPIATIYIPGCCTITTKALGVHQVACQPTLPLPSSKSPPSEDWGAALLAGVSISITMGRPSVSLKHPSISSITRLLHNGRRQRHECARRKTILALACPYRVFCPSQIAHFNLVAFAFHYNRNHFSFCLQELQTNLLLAAYVFLASILITKIQWIVALDSSSSPARCWGGSALIRNNGWRERERDRPQAWSQ